MTKQEIQSRLPANFECDVPSKTHAVYVHAELKDISFDIADKKVSKLCKDIKHKIISYRHDESTADWCLYDKTFEKQMTSDAKACLKAMKSFFKSYSKEEVRFSDSACDIVRDIMDVIDSFNG